jgi:hypothetical protein
MTDTPLSTQLEGVKIAMDAVQLARVATMVEGQGAMLKTIRDDVEHTGKQLSQMQRDIDGLKRDVGEMKPITQQFSNLRNMGLGMIILLSMMGGTVFAIWQYAKSVMLGQ